MRVFFNGSWCDAGQACVSIFDRGFLYGDAVFDTMPAFAGHIWDLDAHLQRLLRGADYLGIQVPYSAGKLKALLRQALTENAVDDAVLRISVSRGLNNRGLSTTSCNSPTMVIYCFAQPPLEQRQLATAAAVIARVARTPPICIDPAVKSANYLNPILAVREAENAGADEAFMLNTDGYLAEGTTSNVFFANGGTLFTPAKQCGMMPGLMRDTVIQTAQALDMTVQEGRYTPEQLLQADEVFFTHSGCIITSVTAVNDRQYDSPGPITQRLWQAVRHHISDACLKKKA